MPSIRWHRLRGPHLTLLALVLACASLPSALATPAPVTVTLRQGTGGYSGCTDTFLYEYDPTYNYGNSDEQFWVQKRSSHDKTALIRFDLTGQLPANACVKSAKLRLYQYAAYNFSSGDWLDVGVYRAVKAWEEGTGGDSGTPGAGACWTYRTTNPLVAWTAGGARGANADRNDGTDDVQRCMDGARWVEWDVTPSVQHWQGNPSRNYGLVLDWTAIGGHTIGGLNFRCSEWGSERPELVITYVIPEAEPCVSLRLSDLSLNYWNTDAGITFSGNSGQLLCSGTTTDTAWGADGAATTYTLNGSFESSIRVKLQQGIVGVNQGQVGFGLYEPGTNNYIRINAVGYSAQYYEISGVCAACGNGERHDGSAYWASYWDDDYPTGPPSGAARFFSQTPENEAASYLTYRIRYDKPNGMFYVYVNDALVTYYSNVNFSNWRIGIEHENNYSGVPTTVWTAFVDCSPPTPNPMTWSAQPHATGVGQIEMTATTASEPDSPPVAYAFVETTGHPGGTSVEQASTFYADTGLSANTQYGYKVRARDSYSPVNWTGYSAETLKYTLMPAPTGLNVDVTATSASLSAVDTFPNLTVGLSGIYFDADPDALGGINEWIQTGSDLASVSPNTQYTFKIKARNGDGLETTWAQNSDWTPAAVPGALPYSPVGIKTVQANWGANGNPAGTQYLCQEVTTGKTSGWITSTFWFVQGLDRETEYHFRVKARNGEGVETDWCDLGAVRTNLTVGEIKSRFGLGEPVALTCKVVTASFPKQNLFFVEDPVSRGSRDGSSGIGVRPAGPALPASPGDLVDISGVLVTNDPPYDREVIISADMVRFVGKGPVPRPYLVTNRDDGGAGFGCQEGLFKDISVNPPIESVGANCVGMLICSNGLVGYGGLGGDPYFWIDDNSGVYDGVEKGTRVDIRGMEGWIPMPPPIPHYYVVTGIMRCMMLPGANGKMYNMRVLWPRAPGDIRPYFLPVGP